MAQLTVCVADDNVDETLTLCEGLRLNGYQALPAHSGEEALDCCRSGQVDLLLLDVRMLDLDGLAVCRELSADHRTRDIPIIFVSALGDSEDVEEGLRLGAVDYIPKPYSLPMVLMQVEAAIQTQQQHDPTRCRDGIVQDSCFTDHLTGLKNRRCLMERLQEEMEKAHRYHHPLSCVVLDIEEALPMDGQMGTASVDDVLAEVGMAMRRLSRTFDIIARFDDTLFAAVLPHATFDDANAYVTKLRKEFASATFCDPPTRVSIAYAIVTCGNGAPPCADDIVGEAMRTMLQAKSKGGLAARDLSAEPA